MTSGTGTEITLADLAKKVDDQARFTRSVSIICTIAILGVMFYTLTEMFSNLPAAIVLHYMANLEKIVYEWNAIENTVAKKKPLIGNPENPANRIGGDKGADNSK